VSCALRVRTVKDHRAVRGQVPRSMATVGCRATFRQLSREPVRPPRKGHVHRRPERCQGWFTLAALELRTVPVLNYLAEVRKKSAGLFTLVSSCQRPQPEKCCSRHVGVVGRRSEKCLERPASAPLFVPRLDMARRRRAIQRSWRPRVWRAFLHQDVILKFYHRFCTRPNWFSLKGQGTTLIVRSSMLSAELRR
jgi:hypothetical protein